jgi:hypothetical protein
VRFYLSYGYGLIQVMLHLHECDEPTPAKSAEPLHSVGDSAAVEPLHSAEDPAAAEYTAESLQPVADSDAIVDALTETSYS